MIVAPFRVLLLGWNEAPRSGEAAVPLVRPLVGRLAPLAPLAVMLPHLPAPAFAASPDLRVTGLAELDLTNDLNARANPRPAAWRHPAAPYVGATLGGPGSYTAPAAPYQGATPREAASIATTAQVQAKSSPDAPKPNSMPAPVEASGLPGPPPEVAAADLLINRDDFAREAEPEAGEARKLDQVSAETLPEPEPEPTEPPRVRATLTEALAALGVDLPATTDLNFQVIQYARFATRRALQEDFAVIYAVDWPTWLAGMEIRQLTGRPLVLHVHELAQERGAEGASGWSLALERLALRRADLVLAASDDVARLLLERYQLSPERLRMVPLTDTATVNTILHQLETRLSGHPAAAPLFPPTP
ncbi:hypothetical protein CDA63_10080 [Hymenobacter amundsenii]|uniref:Glycosyltransferase subfamily 4-like N-terminal domain-containing protein n=1 Tax=Hymenobacter amundsenii TaxID=2006685 RepID=A0A2D0AFL0_9BACT|nr:glycosyltransferase family 4 protein [Hymenobacter amundsenii]OWP63195.1 hypothetical protein CDA63_10080 [Hymenobacter amundsenii]